MPARILVIDDNRTNLDLMTYLLNAFGHEATGITDPTVALEQARAGAFDAIISDILMPEIDGFSLARMFKADPQLQNTPLIAVTALAMAGDRERVLAAGFSGYISKPIDPQSSSRRSTRFCPKRFVASILIVDDEPANRLLVKTILEHAGHQVAEAADGAQALHQASEHVPDLAIVDLHLPGTSGVELVQMFRRDPRTSTMRIALYTGSTVDAATRDFMAVNRVEHVIPKPCEPQDLISTVAQALSS